jgi:hypothetical protein
VFVLVRTSNLGSADFQRHGEPELSFAIAERVARWGERLMGECGLSSVGAVVGATHARELAAFRERMPRTPFVKSVTMTLTWPTTACRTCGVAHAVDLHEAHGALARGAFQVSGKQLEIPQVKISVGFGNQNGVVAPRLAGARRWARMRICFTARAGDVGFIRSRQGGQREWMDSDSLPDSVIRAARVKIPD